MRIQHNIMALNAYRNYNNNIGTLSKNLEKLSSGYRINRAGDDAAGLAISEKMRAQITGLDAAQKNVKDGISLVKTAEGALQEVQDMMNRMKYLAVQSANGTYDNEVDRANLQKEVDALKTEINRIADSANFNGQKLLNGELATDGVGGGSAAAVAGVVDLETELNDAELTIKDVAATKGTYTLTALTDGQIKDGETLKLSFTLSDNTVKDVQLTAKDFTDGSAGGELIGADGTVYGKYAAGGSTGPTAAELGDAFNKAIKDSDLAKDFKVSDNGSGALTLTNIVAGADAPQVMQNVNVQKIDKVGTVTESTNTVAQVKGEDAYQTIDASQLTEYNGQESTVLNINGKKFALLVQDGTATTDDLMKKATEAGLEVIMVKDVDQSATGGDADGSLRLNAADGADTTDGDYSAWETGTTEQGNTIAAALSKALGYKVDFNKAKDPDATTNLNGTNANFSFKIDTTIDPTKKVGGALTLQIGDTADEFNQMEVAINDMHVDALGIGDLDISTLEGAQAAVDTITNAINTVSSTRGDLGAIQNRLEHTTNNLAVMKENIQDAESSIRDTDVADEMMKYTKNNILIQSAQAMLAQANAVPQGVLQLLQ